ncbi:uncharacterized protein PRCAT00001807001 [Priceomyces carsonii]|uniref:uncharacterized protein n=1 Tax=Priceomyces carsonii TaxID=28549 RepID=UPI002EDABBBE|nr:unnamed protein product [Priceomyces carsonii]
MKDENSLLSALEIRQQDELNSLKSIYGDIMKDITSDKLIWNKKPSPHFQVFLESSENPEKPTLSLTLDIEFTPTYPVSPPIVKILKPKNILKANLTSLKQKIQHLIKEYPEEEVSFTIISELKVLLDEYQHAMEKTMSLEQERELRLRTERLQLEKEDAKKQQEQEDAKKEENQKLNQQIIKIQGEYYNEMSDESDENEDDLRLVPTDTEKYFTFENTMVGQIPGSKQKFRFRSVLGFAPVKYGDLLSRLGDQYIVRPYLATGVTPGFDKKGNELSYVFTEISFNNSFWMTDSGKSEIQDLERELQLALNITNDNISKLVGFQIDKMKESGWKLRLLSENFPRAVSLLYVLSKVNFVNWAIARVWFIQLLSGIEYLHNSGFIHKIICPLTVYVHPIDNYIYKKDITLFDDELFDDDEAKDMKFTQLKLIYPSFGFKILQFFNLHPNDNVSLNIESLIETLIPFNWQSPESKKGNIQPKSDIWDLGVLFTRIMLGNDVVTTKYKTPDELFHKFSAEDFQGAESYSKLVFDMLSKLLQVRLTKRPSPLELNAAGFLRDGPTSIPKHSESKFLSSASLRKLEELMSKDAKDKSTPASAMITTNTAIPASTASKRRRSYSQQMSMNRTESLTQEFNSNNKRIGRYERDFEEIGRLGKGGFGEVVKARNRMEGTFYAIKKIRHRAYKLDSLLSEVLSLARLNHQYIVRYYGTWVEEVGNDDNGVVDSDVNSSSEDEFDGPLNTKTSSYLQSHDNSYQIDYISNSFDPHIEFSDSSIEEEFDERIVFANDSDESDNNTTGHSSVDTTPTTHNTLSSAPGSRVPHNRLQQKSILYIQMEFCENNTLQNLIEQGLPSNHNEYWRLFRQLLEAVSYIHREGFIHRDLKPTNVFIDKSNNIKVGDFGLARNSQFSSVLLNNNQVSSKNNEDLSTVVGTVFYTAKEVASGHYNEKVDMYSLGIIFFEMCFPLATGMERAQILNNLRLVTVDFPHNFLSHKFKTERKIIRSLLDHEPKKRPGATELLQSGWLPVEHQDQVIKEALKSLADPASPWQQQVRETLFNQPYLLAEDLLFDNFSKNTSSMQLNYDVPDYLLFTTLIEKLFRIFKNHGAIQDLNSNTILPKSPFQSRELVYEFLDRSGRVLTLPYDLTLPNARVLSRSKVGIPKIYKHEFVYRPSLRGSGLPDKYSAVNFDITTHDSACRPENDAECLKIIDEILQLFPCFKIKNSQALIVVNHFDILSSVIEFAFGNIGIDQKQMHEISGVLSQIGIDKSADEVKNYLRENFKVPHTVVKDLVDEFNFTMELPKVKSKLQKLMVDSPLLLRVERALAYLECILTTSQKLGIKSPVLFNPLSNYNNKYYKHGIMFQAVFRVDRVRKFTRVITGGRYDNLISSFVNEDISKSYTPCAVGFSLTATFLFLLMKNLISRKMTCSERQLWRGLRCDVLITSLNGTYIKQSGFEIARRLWSQNISCDVETVLTQEEILERSIKEGANWIIVIKQPISYQKRKSKKSGSSFKPLKIKNVSHNKDIDVEYDELIPFLISEIEERNQELDENHQSVNDEESSKDDYLESEEQTSAGYDVTLFTADIDQKITLVANDAPRGRKNNKREKWEVENDSKLASALFIKKLATSPVLVVDARDEVLDMIAITSIHQPEDWMRKIIYASNNLPKSFAQNIHNSLVKESLKGHEWAVLHSPKSNKTTVVDLQR